MVDVVNAVISDSTKKMLNEKIKYYSGTGKDQEDFVRAEINNYLLSPEYAEQVKALEYSMNKTDIQDKKRLKYERRAGKTTSESGRPGAVEILDEDNYAKGSDLVAVEDPIAPNTKVEFPFYRKLIKQKLNYLLGKPFSIKTDDDEYTKAWNEIMDLRFRSTIKKLARDAVNFGKGWGYVHYDEEGKLRVSKILAPNAIPYWADDEHTILDALIRFYEFTVYEGTTSKTIKRVEFYTYEGVYKYTLDSSGNMVNDSEKGQLFPNFNILKEVVNEKGEKVNEAVGGLWTKIPMLCMKYSDDELSLFTIVKSMIDEYTRITCSVSDTIKEMPQAVRVVKNYDGDDKAEFLKNLYESRIAFVDGDGAMETQQIQTDDPLTDKHLTKLRKNIFELGGGIDMQNAQVSNTSGVALKMIYGDLDLDCMDFGDNIKNFFNQLKWFVDTHIFNTTGKDYYDKQIEIEFNIDMITNETEVINNCVNSSSMLDMKTILNNHPWVTDVVKVMQEKAKEDKVKMNEYMQQGGNFGEIDNNTNKEDEEKEEDKKEDEK